MGTEGRKDAIMFIAPRTYAAGAYVRGQVLLRLIERLPPAPRERGPAPDPRTLEGWVAATLLRIRAQRAAEPELFALPWEPESCDQPLEGR